LARSALAWALGAVARRQRPLPWRLRWPAARNYKFFFKIKLLINNIFTVELNIIKKIFLKV
jgi:hypothetical protein